MAEVQIKASDILKLLRDQGMIVPTDAQVEIEVDYHTPVGCSLAVTEQRTINVRWPT